MSVEQMQEKIVDNKCWAFFAGPMTEARFHLVIGKKIRRLRPLTNPALSSDEKNFDGEFVIAVEDASWRITRLNSIIATSRDDNSVGGRMLSGFEKLMGRPVTTVAIAKMSFDLFVNFNQGYKLEVFCDVVGKEYSDNYSLYDKNQIYTFSTIYNQDSERHIECIVEQREGLS